MNQQKNNIRQAYAMLNRFLERYDNLCDNAISEIEYIILLLGEEVEND